MKEKRFFFSLAVVLLTLVFSVLTVHSAEAARRHRRGISYQPPPDRLAFIVMEYADGRVLAEKSADRPLYPASLTKMMTLYLTFEALESGRVRKNDRVRVSMRAASQEPSSLGLDAGTTIRLEDAIYALVTKSANDAAVALGEHLGGGSEIRFAQRMNEKARMLGMSNTRFVNASGLFHARQVSTARDMAKLSRALVRDYPREYRYFSTSSFTWAGRVMTNHNRLMASYEGMDGIKTGYVHQSGFNLAASAVRNGRRLIGVVFGGKTTASRNAQMRSLLDKGFATPPRVTRIASAAPLKATKLKPRARVQEGEGDAELAMASPAAGGGHWGIQIGSFSNKDTTVQALGRIHKELLGGSKTWNGKAMVAPLATSRGVIFRARFSGLSQSEAENACRKVKGDCLVLSMP